MTLQVHDEIEFVWGVKGLNHGNDILVLDFLENGDLSLNHFLLSLNHLLVNDLEGIFNSSLPVCGPLDHGEVSTVAKIRRRRRKEKKKGKD
jgi:hypothetical protein